MLCHPSFMWCNWRDKIKLNTSKLNHYLWDKKKTWKSPGVVPILESLILDLKVFSEMFLSCLWRSHLVNIFFCLEVISSLQGGLLWTIASTRGGGSRDSNMLRGGPSLLCIVFLLREVSLSFVHETDLWCWYSTELMPSFILFPEVDCTPLWSANLSFVPRDESLPDL